MTATYPGRGALRYGDIQLDFHGGHTGWVGHSDLFVKIEMPGSTDPIQ
jgi:hypothetical protein